jgi:hypothetical protein
MNKSVLKIFLAGLTFSFLFLGSCKKNNLVVDQDVVPPSYVKFNTLQAADTIGTYYIRSTNDPFKLPIGVTTVSDKDRTINFTYTSTAAQTTQYNAPSSIVIPAGKALDSLTISGLFSGYGSATRKDTLKIQITGGDVPASPYKATYYLILRKYCDVFLADFDGDYTNSDDNGTYGPYFTSVTPGSGTATGPTSATMTIENIWDPGVPVITSVNLDWSNPANFTVTIPDQEYFGPADIWIKGTLPGSFSSCDQTFILRYTLYYKSTNVDFAADQVTTLRR